MLDGLAEFFTEDVAPLSYVIAVFVAVGSVLLMYVILPWLMQRGSFGFVEQAQTWSRPLTVVVSIVVAIMIPIYSGLRRRVG